MAAALGWEHEQGLSVADDLSFLHQFEHITLARLRIAQYKQGGNDNAMVEAMALLNRLLKVAEEGRWLTSMIEILLLQAVAHQALDNFPLARVPLARALTLAEPEGFIRIFADEGLPMAQLLADAATQGIMPNYVDRLLSAFEEQRNVHPTPPGKQSVSRQPLVEPLSERELDVLRLLRTELNGPEIASTLMVSLNTMRTHTKNIYNKLGVNDRRAAVHRAGDS